MLYANWPSLELFQKLAQLANIPTAQDQVGFELGCCKVADALGSTDGQVASHAFLDARFWFDKSLAANPDRCDAAIYSLCLRTLNDFRNARTVDLRSVSQQMRELVILLRAWHRTDSDPRWLSDQTRELLHWEDLSTKLLLSLIHISEPTRPY